MLFSITKRSVASNWLFPFACEPFSPFIILLRKIIFPLRFKARLCGQKYMVREYCQIGQLFHDAVLGRLLGLMHEDSCPYSDRMTTPVGVYFLVQLTIFASPIPKKLGMKKSNAAISKITRVNPGKIRAATKRTTTTGWDFMNATIRVRIESVLFFIIYIPPTNRVTLSGRSPR